MLETATRGRPRGAGRGVRVSVERQGGKAVRGEERVRGEASERFGAVARKETETDAVF